MVQLMALPAANADDQQEGASSPRPRGPVSWRHRLPTGRRDSQHCAGEHCSTLYRRAGCAEAWVVALCCQGRRTDLGAV
jgi:hypothetical protein